MTGQHKPVKMATLSRRCGKGVWELLIYAADHGAPQNRVRMFLVLARSRAPLMLNLQSQQHIPARSFIDLNSGNWQPINKPGRANLGQQQIGEEAA